MMNVDLCKILEIEIIATDKEIDLQSIRENWWSKQTIENLLLQNLIRNLECKEFETQTFECNENINVNVEFLQHQIDYIMKQTISLY